ncbi:DNA-3-methyladenine glycosylase family protein [Deinococcus marmoris]|uniref:DNA-3-methyladenine glycosylase II n=1 Tax=Deinococcus marmoris TaxID=249408 RepID=A0A1U7NV52_9DEIO|nr:DNA-3-methyladenine glycosylase [Deinococcus marmoris]OLV16780.1 DNA-3-methyladenine glycosylase II [Deinococcus marmoris]
MTAPLLPVTPPFDLRHTLAFLNGFPPAQGEQNTAGELRKATRLNGQTVGFVVGQDTAGLKYTLHPEQPLTGAETAALLERLASFLATGDDLQPFYDLAEQDTAFGPTLKAMHGFHQPRFLTPFEVACWAVLTQRLPNAQALRLKRRVTEACGGEWEGRPAFPEPTELAGLTEAEWLALVGQERKARALLAVTRAFSEVSETELHQRSTAELRAWLLGLYGIGDWSALFILVRGLGRKEVLEVGADGPLRKELLRAARPIYGDLSAAELTRVAQRYGDQQGQWATYLRSRAAVIGPMVET